jgi:hypothetical protein
MRTRRTLGEEDRHDRGDGWEGKGKGEMKSGVRRRESSGWKTMEEEDKGEGERGKK